MFEIPSDGVLQYTVKEHHVLDDHNVAWVYYEAIDRPEAHDHMLWCDCDKEKHQTYRSGGCSYKAAVRHWKTHQLHQEFEENLREKKQSLYGDDRAAILEAAVLEYFYRHLDGEWIGQSDGYSLYYQTLAPIIGLPEGMIFEIVDKLYRDKTIGLSGAMMMPWSDQFEPKDDDDEGLDDMQPPDDAGIDVTTHFYAETGTEGGYWATMEGWDEETHRKNGYNGLHTLKTGDWIAILDPEDTAKTLWSGYIRLRHYPLFTEAARGMWIHADQRGIDREEWAAFFTGYGYPARLVKRSTVIEEATKIIASAE